MAKKRVHKKTIITEVFEKKSPKKKTSKKSVKKPAKKIPQKEKNIEKILIENFVSLQKVMTNLSVSFNELSNKISKLLELFELSAEALAKKEIKITKPVDEKKILQGLENISDQNKIIARGLTLMHERIGEEPEEAPSIPEKASSIPPAPGAPRKMPPPKEEYQKSPFSQGF